MMEPVVEGTKLFEGWRLIIFVLFNQVDLSIIIFIHFVDPRGHYLSSLRNSGDLGSEQMLLESGEMGVGHNLLFQVSSKHIFDLSGKLNLVRSHQR